MSLMSEYLKLARRMLFVVLWGLVAPGSAFAAGNALQEEVAGLYDKSLEQLFKHFHANPTGGHTENASCNRCLAIA